MRLPATARALRSSSGRWSTALTRASIPRAQPILPITPISRGWSSTAALRDVKPKGRGYQPQGPIKEIKVQNKSYPADEWTNITGTIQSHVGRRLYLDENHPLAITRKLIESQFAAPVFGNYFEKDPVVSTFQNFDVLGFPADHPGRSRTDTYYANRTTVLRTHTSAHQQKYFQQINRNEKERPTEVGYTVIADVYRRDAIDRSHYPVFHQMEGAMLWKRPDNDPLSHSKETAAKINADIDLIPRHDVVVEDPNATINENNPLQAEYHSAEEVEAISAHLKRSLERMVIKVFTEGSKAADAAAGAGGNIDPEPLKVRWVEAYFPFTSPSWELEVFWQGEWLEILGCGVIKQDLLNNSDVSNRVGWAFGLGIERIAMLLFNIPDIRLFWSRDERFLSQFRAGEITRFEPFSKHPACYKDVSFWLPQPHVYEAAAARGQPLPEVHENDVMEIVRGVGGDLIEDVSLIDNFVHPKTKRKSLCYRINYRSLERTLTNEEANELHDKIGSKLIGELGVQLRN